MSIDFANSNIILTSATLKIGHCGLIDNLGTAGKIFQKGSGGEGIVFAKVT